MALAICGGRSHTRKAGHSVKLPRDGEELYTYDPDAGTAATTFEVQLLPGGAWVAATYTDGVASLLVRGPDFTGNSNGVQVITSCQPRVRWVDGTQAAVIRQGEWILLRPAGVAPPPTPALPTLIPEPGRPGFIIYSGA